MKDHKGIEMEKFITTGPEGGPWYASRGHRIQLERRTSQDLQYVPLLGSVGEVLWSSQAKSRLVNSYKEE